MNVLHHGQHCLAAMGTGWLPPSFLLPRKDWMVLSHLQLCQELPVAVCPPGHAHRNSEQNSSSGGVSSPARFSSSWWLQAAPAAPWPFESVLVLAKPFFATVGIFLQALERNGALCLPTFDDQMALLFPIHQQSLEEFPTQPSLFSTPSPLISLLTDILGWRQNCHWWSLRCASETALPTRAWSSPPAVWECANTLSQNSYSSFGRRCRVHSLTFAKPLLRPWLLSATAGTSQPCLASFWSSGLKSCPSYIQTPRFLLFPISPTARRSLAQAQRDVWERNLAKGLN